MKKINTLSILLLLSIFVFSGCKTGVEPDNSSETQNEETETEKAPEIDPNKINAYIITYVTDKGITPEQIALAEGATLMEKHLPVLSIDSGYYNFEGWYSEGTKIEVGYIIKKNLTLNANWIFDHYDYTTTDYSANVVEPTGNSSFSVDGEYTKIQPKSSSNIPNWVISRKENGNNYQLSDVYGFELKVKCDTEIDWAGMEWLNKTSYNCYYFEVHGDGSFKVRFHDNDNKKWTTVIELKATDSHVNKNGFNTIKVEPTVNSDFEVYVNDNLVGTIERTELSITPGPIAFAGSGKKGSALLKMMSYKQVK